MPQFSIALSGLNAASQALAVISNNLANLNTSGFKDQQVSFNDLFYQNLGTSGSGNAIQVGSGTGVSAVSSNFADGNTTSTGVSTDMAITGNGFFVIQQNNQMLYTRDGAFTKNTAGQLATADGSLVMGYPASGGVVNLNGALAPIQVGSSVSDPPKATASLSVTSNLSCAASVGDTLNAPVTVYDSLGQPHDLNIQFAKTATNAWSYSIQVPSADVAGAGTTTTLKSGTLTFDGSGKLATVDGTAVTSSTSVSFDIKGLGGTTSLSDGADPMMGVKWNIFDSSGVAQLTQTSGSSATSAQSQDGYTGGSLQSFAVKADGTLEGTFSNGRVLAIGQVALANFGNVQGLQREGSNSYSATLTSGSAVIGTPDTGGRGTIAGQSLEQSNVDVATELSNLIVAQRGYEANAKVVTTMNSVTQSTMNLIQG